MRLKSASAPPGTEEAAPRPLDKQRCGQEGDQDADLSLLITQPLPASTLSIEYGRRLERPAGRAADRDDLLFIGDAWKPRKNGSRKTSPTSTT